MPRGLVALSASAVAVIYVSGYVRTQSADASLDVAQAVAAAASPTAAATALPDPTAVPRAALPTQVPPTRSIAPSTRAASPTRTPATPTAQPNAQSATLKDGTFSGQGQSRRGGVWVGVTVTDGKISSVTITKSTLQYPVRDIAGLPDQVLKRQSASVDVVSGATYSTQAFRSAVTQALANARA